MATVADIMERDPIAVGRDDDVESVIRVLREHELPGVPVVDGSGKLVGIITENDLILRDEEADLHLPHHLDTTTQDTGTIRNRHRWCESKPLRRAALVDERCSSPQLRRFHPRRLRYE